MFTPPYLSDKFYNGLMDVYRQLLSAVQYKPIVLLEIGIADGGSVQFWDDFLHHADSRIIGLDLHIPLLETSSRVTLVQGDQNDQTCLQEMGQRHGPFDVVIDDGAHQEQETRQCFESLFPSVMPGGFYIIEDWAVGYCAQTVPQYAGMTELITELLQHAPQRGIADFHILRETTRSIALFRKGEAG